MGLACSPQSARRFTGGRAEPYGHGPRINGEAGSGTSPAAGRRWPSQLPGAVAQLGERLHGMQEVVGSTPIGSIFISHTERWT